MADKILHKRSSTPSAVPSAASLELGELALNTADGRAFMKKGDGSVVEIGANGSASFSLVTVTATSAGQASFTIPGGYTPGAVVVFLNGSSLAPAHYTATSGTAVVLASGTGVVVGSELVVLRLTAFQVADALPLDGTAADSSKLGGIAAENYWHSGNLDPSALGGGDMLSQLLFTETAVSGAIALSASAFGRMHVCSGTASDYSVTLPAASGNAGKMIALRMSPALTKLVSVTASGGDSIDGQVTRVMWAGESAVLMCTGAGWAKIAGVSKPLSCGAYPTTGVTAAASPTLTLIPLGASIFDTSGLMASLSDNRIKVLRPGVYRVSANVYYQSGSAVASSAQCIVNKNGVTGGVGSFTEWRSLPAAEPYRSIFIDDASLSSGDYIQLMARISSARAVYVNDPTWTFLKVSEVISW